MSNKQCLFFITKPDVEVLLREVENTFEIEYYLMGLFDKQSTIHYSSIFNDPEVGFASFGDWNHIDRYLMLPKNIQLNIRNVPQKKGGIKYAIDQMTNPKSLEIKLGGVYKEKDKVIIGGRIGTVSVDPFSLELYNFFSKKIKKEFKKIGSFYVGKDAEDKLDDGWRLVTSIGSPKEYDLIK